MIRRERGGESQTLTSSLATGTGHIPLVGTINLYNWTLTKWLHLRKNKDVIYYILIYMYMYLSLPFIEKDKKYGVITDENFTRFPGIFNTYAYQTTTSILNNNQSKFIKGTDLKKECCITLSFLTKIWGQHF